MVAKRKILFAIFLAFFAANSVLANAPNPWQPCPAHVKTCADYAGKCREKSCKEGQVDGQGQCLRSCWVDYSHCSNINSPTYFVFFGLICLWMIRFFCSRRVFEMLGE